MKDSLIQKLQMISAEEQSYLDGNAGVRQEIYSHEDMAEVDCELLLREGHLITVRPHSRFVEFPPHRHNYIEIMYVCQGEITHYIDGQTLVMKKGDIIFMNRRVMHGIKRAEYEDIGINFIALPEFFDIPLGMVRGENVLAQFLVDTLRQEDRTSSYLLFRLGDMPEIENLMENMVASIMDERANEDVINQYSMGLVFLYLLNHLDSLKGESSRSCQEVLIQTTLSYIDTHYKTANLTKLAEDMHQSLSALSRMIKRHTGFTFQELLQRKRFQKAVMLLMETDLPVEEIAGSVGYENHSYFYRQFRKKYGITPGKYRLTHKEDIRIRI